MPIRIRCHKCASTLSVNDTLAGKRGKCPKCGTILVVPLQSNDAQNNVRTLTKASTDEMIAELLRRGKSAALILFDTPKDGRYELHDIPDVVVNCVGSDDMTAEQLNTVIRSVATLSQRHEQAASFELGEQSKVPYEFRGDMLGMSLDDFKRKHYRKVQGHDKIAPFTSEYSPGQEIDSLLAEPWHTAAGIVHCSLDFPFERYNGGKHPTVAGVDVEFLIYRFVDGRLYRISAFFDTRVFDAIRYALIERYGEPAKEEKKPVQLFWWNGCSSIALNRGRISPKEFSQLNFTLDELQGVVLERSPKRSQDL